MISPYLTEGPNRVVTADFKDALLLLLLDRCQCRLLAMGNMEVKEILYVHVADAVAVGKHEPLVADIRLDALDAPPVMVPRPVSTTVTFHGSVRWLWIIALLPWVKSNVTSLV